MASTIPRDDLPSQIRQDPASILIKKLQHPSSVLAPNVWGQAKDQPAYFDITLNLRESFNSAATKDVLDESTIHYGELAKKIRSACAASLDPLATIAKAQGVIEAMGMKSERRFIVANVRISLSLPKASMNGQRVRLTKADGYSASGQTNSSIVMFELEDLKLMGLIGVNGYERSAKQPIIATIAVETSGPNDLTNECLTSQQVARLFALENSLASIVQESSFETLESLADFAIKTLIRKLDVDGHAGSLIRLTLEKPKAIAFADAAVVEVVRRVDSRSHKNVSGTQASRSTGSLRVKLKITKPYV